MPSVIDVNSSQEVIIWTRLSSNGDIISCRHLGRFGQVAQLDSGVRARDALECAYARQTEMRPPSGWKRPPGRPKQTWLHQIGDGTAASIRQEWDLVVGRGHSRRTKRDRRYGPPLPKCSDDDDVYWGAIIMGTSNFQWVTMLMHEQENN